MRPRAEYIYKLTKEECFCSYCNRIITDNLYVLDYKGNKYHEDCWEQMNTYDDPFE